MIAEDSELFDDINGDAGFFGQLGGGAVLVEPDHGGKAFRRESTGLSCRDHAIGITRVADDYDAAILSGDSINGPTLRHENVSVILQQVGTFHTRTPWLGAHEQAPLCILESLLGLAGTMYLLQQREGAVLEFHGNACEGFLDLLVWDFQELKNDRGFFPEHFACRDAF